jgi:hypothetical protein
LNCSRLRCSSACIPGTNLYTISCIVRSKAT